MVVKCRLMISTLSERRPPERRVDGTLCISFHFYNGQFVNCNTTLFPERALVLLPCCASFIYHSRQDCVCWCWGGRESGGGVSMLPGQRRLPPAPQPGHHNCWAGRAAAWRSALLSTYGPPPAPPAASWAKHTHIHTQVNRFKHICTNNFPGLLKDFKAYFQEQTFPETSAYTCQIRIIIHVVWHILNICLSEYRFDFFKHFIYFSKTFPGLDIDISKCPHKWLNSGLWAAVWMLLSWFYSQIKQKNRSDHSQSW